MWIPKECASNPFVMWLATLFLLASTLLSPLVQACFPMSDVFEFSTLWIQTTAINNDKFIVVGQEGDNIMTVETEGGPESGRKLTVYCLTDYGSNRYAVRVEEPYMNTYYQCIRFEPLAPLVVRQSKTKKRQAIKKTYCLNDKYEEDDAMLMAYHNLPRQPCPLSGGYQLIMHQSQAVAADCVDTVQSYNPRLQFECDHGEQGNVYADFGRVCEPITAGRFLGTRKAATLKCIGSWQENGFSTVVLQMRDMERVYWCLHYKPSARGSYKTVRGMESATNNQDEFYTAFLTLDGRCSKKAFSNGDVPRNTSMFGFLARYTPESDPRCTEEEYLRECQRNEMGCFESSVCPSVCHRCNKPVKKKSCSFSEETFGDWKTYNTLASMEIELSVGSTKFSSPKFGEFECRSSFETSLPSRIYPVVQSDPSSTCMPYYACAEVRSHAPGFLNFHLRPSLRDESTGEPLGCTETYDWYGYGYSGLSDIVKAEQTITLINEEKLKVTPCKFLDRQLFPTLISGCMLVVEECSEQCHTLEVNYDENTCGNDSSSWPFQIEHKHTCFSTVAFEDSVMGILTRSELNDRYLCWLFGSTRLFISSPQDCNPERVRNIFGDTSADRRYDPLNAIALPQTHSSHSRGIRLGDTFAVVSTIVVLCLGAAFSL